MKKEIYQDLTVRIELSTKEYCVNVVVVMLPLLTMMTTMTTTTTTTTTLQDLHRKNTDSNELGSQSISYF